MRPFALDDAPPSRWQSLLVYAVLVLLFIALVLGLGRLALAPRSTSPPTFQEELSPRATLGTSPTRGHAVRQNGPVRRGLMMFATPAESIGEMWVPASRR